MENIWDRSKLCSKEDKQKHSLSSFREQNMTLTWELLILQKTASLENGSVSSVAEKKVKKK